MTKQIKLTRGQFAQVSDKDYSRVSQYKWHAIEPSKNTWYAARTIPKLKKEQMLHHFILEVRDDEEVDHVDRNGLNCTRQNLRRATRSQNCANRRKQSNNTSGFKGVVWHKQRQKWIAQTKCRGKRIYIGLYKSAEEAARAYDFTVRQLFGEFASPNFDISTALPTPDRDNPTGFRGVYFNPKIRKFQSHLSVNKKRHYLGQSDTAEEAALKYDAAARELLGASARLNFPDP